MPSFFAQPMTECVSPACVTRTLLRRLSELTLLVTQRQLPGS